MLNVEELVVAYNESIVLRNVSLSVPDGRIVCLMGRNGAGKTTLLKSIIGLLKPRRGNIQLNGEEITNMTPDQRARMGIGYVPQGRDIFPYLTVYENLAVGIDGRSGNGIVLQDIIGMFPALKSIMSRMGGVLSGGQQQQLAIARALVRQPSVLVLDEPTEGIQPSVVMEIEDVIRRLNSEQHMSILLVEQYLDFSLRVADYFYVMETGQIVWQGERRDVEPDVLKGYLAV